MLEMYCIIGDLTKSLHFFDLILSLGPNHSTIANAQSSLTLLYAFKNNTEKVKGFIGLSKTYGGDQPIRFALRALGGYLGCDTHLQSSQPSTAIWNWMSEVGIQPDKTCCLFILRAFSEEGKLEEAAKVFEEMKKREIEVSNPITEVMTVVFARLGDLHSVETMEKEAVERGHPIGHSKITSHALIETYLELNSPEKALGVLDSLEQSGKLDVVGFTPLFQYYMNLKDHKNVQSLLKRMKESGIGMDLLGWNMLLSYYSDNKDIVRMEQAYNDLLLAGFEPDSVTYNTLLKAYCKVNGLAEVEKLLSEMEKRGNKLNTAGYSTLLNMCCEQGDLQMMKAIFARIISEGHVIPDINIYNVLVKGYASKGHEGTYHNDHFFRFVTSLFEHETILLQNLTSFLSTYQRGSEFCSLDNEERGHTFH
jgi:pentatricopeptide repeat protein